MAPKRWVLAHHLCQGGEEGDEAWRQYHRSSLCYLLKDVEISNIEEGRALNSWLIGLKF